MALNNPIQFVATTNARRARAFYERRLGLRLLSEDQFALVFAIGRSRLRVQKVERVAKAGYTVLGWQVRDIAREVQRLAKGGVRFSRYPWMDQDERGIWCSPSGAKVAWFEDPDGNILSLTELP